MPILLNNTQQLWFTYIFSFCFLLDCKIISQEKISILAFQKLRIYIAGLVLVVARQKIFDSYELATTTVAFFTDKVCYNRCIHYFDVDDNQHGEDQIFCMEDVVRWVTLPDNLRPGEQIPMVYTRFDFYLGWLVLSYAWIRLYISFSDKFWSDAQSHELFATFIIEVYKI